jgi:hypothetical protein
VAMEAMRQDVIVSCDEAPAAATSMQAEDKETPFYSSEFVPASLKQENPRLSSPAPEAMLANETASPHMKATPLDEDFSSFGDLYTDECELSGIQREYRMRLREFRRCASAPRMFGSQMGYSCTCTTELDVG